MNGGSERGHRSLPGDRERLDRRRRGRHRAQSRDLPTRIDFTAFDASGALDFIDITDLTESKVLARIEARDDQRVTWQGSYRFAFGREGPHRLIVRTVRYEPKAGAYTYIDREFTVVVAR
jgi:hypothetical protein